MCLYHWSFQQQEPPAAAARNFLQKPHETACCCTLNLCCWLLCRTRLCVCKDRCSSACLHHVQGLTLRSSSQLGVCTQGGDCFDICTVLCSLLLGAGFDAYVVAGYAPLAVTISDQTSAVCPLLEPSTPKAKPQKMQPASSQKQPVQPKEAKYQIKSDVKPESAFLQVHSSVPLYPQEEPLMSHCVSLLFCQLAVHSELCQHLQAGHQKQLCCSSAT